MKGIFLPLKKLLSIRQMKPNTGTKKILANSIEQDSVFAFFLSAIPLWAKVMCGHAHLYKAEAQIHFIAILRYTIFYPSTTNYLLHTFHPSATNNPLHDLLFSTTRLRNTICVASTQSLPPHLLCLKEL